MRFFGGEWMYVGEKFGRLRHGQTHQKKKDDKKTLYIVTFSN